MKTLEQLLRMTVPVGPGCVAPEGTPYSPDFIISVQEVRPDCVRIIARAMDHDSDTLDFEVRGNQLTELK